MKAIVLFSALLVLTVHAKPSSVSRGGAGFLFTDKNSFSNPGQVAIGKGTALEMKYERQDRNGANLSQSATTSVAFGNGVFGIGAFGTRSGTELSKSANSTDSAGAELGVALAKEKLTAGVGYSRSIDSAQADNGALTGTLSMNPSKERGVAFGAGGSTTLGRTTNVVSAIAALGYSFKANNSFEGTFELPDVKKTKTYTGSAFVTLGGPKVYFGSGYSYVKVENANAVHQVQGRLGFVVANYVDFSAFATQTLQSGQTPLWGGSLRASF